MFTSPQYYTIVVLSVFSATLSSLGSFATLVASWRGKKSSLYQIIMLLLSAVDLMGSFALIFHPFSLPRPLRSEGVLWASGNDATCGTAGFFFVACAPLVSLFHMYLSGYFLAKVNYTQDGVLSKNYLWHGVALAFFVCLALAFMASASQSFVPRPYYNLCYFDFCSEGDDDCEGITSRVLHWVQMGLVVVPAVISLLLTITVLATVRYKLVHGQKLDTTGRNQRLPTYHQDKLKAIRIQAVLYSVAFWSSFFWYFMYGIVGRNDEIIVQDQQKEPLYFALALLSWMFFPLHGLFTYAVYIRPRYLQFRMANQSRGASLIQAISVRPVSIAPHLAPTTVASKRKPMNKTPSSRSHTNGTRMSSVWLFGGLDDEILDPSSTQEDTNEISTNRTGRGSPKQPAKPVADNWKDDEDSSDSE